MNSKSSNPTRRSRNPFCTLCANHDIRSELRGHKHECLFRKCPCDLCVRGRERREVMRKQVRLRRQQMKEIYAKVCGKNNPRGIHASNPDKNPSKTAGISFAATNTSISSGRRNLGNSETPLVSSEAVPTITSSSNHQSSQTTQNGSPLYYEYSRFPTHAVSLYPQNNESFAYYLNLSPPGITTPPQCQSPRQCVSPLFGRLSVSENSAFVKLSPGQNRMVLEGGNGWPCEIKDGSNEAALTLASLPLQNKKI